MTVAEAERRIALLIDFENIAIGVEKGQKKVEIQPVLDRLLEKGKIVVKRAYCDWGRFSEYKSIFHEAAIELIEIPRRRQAGKNSADIRMVVDAMDLCVSKAHIDTFALVTGDSDFSPLVSKLREYDRSVIGIGARDSSSDLLIDNCDEFVFYDELVKPASRRKPREPASSAASGSQDLAARKAEGFYLLVDATRALLREGYEPVWASQVKQTIKRKHPAFDETRHGYDTLSEMIEDAVKHGILVAAKDPKSGNWGINGLGKSVGSRAARGEAED
jgi:uncharacterized protein (TIGR00288 family)